MGEKKKEILFIFRAFPRVISRSVTRLSSDSVLLVHVEEPPIANPCYPVSYNYRLSIFLTQKPPGNSHSHLFKPTNKSY